MKIVVAPNAFKNGLTAGEACAAIAAGVERILPDAMIVRIPIADGGDGLVAALHSALGGQIVKKTVTGPLFAKVEAEFLFLPDRKAAVVEMARASGLALLRSEERNARMTTSRGTGELAMAAIDMGAERILVGIGGSASNDGGVGFASALGVRFLDEAGGEVRPIGEDLGKIAVIDMSDVEGRLEGVDFEAACDVDNILTGERGASAVFGPQKGATLDDVRFLNRGLGTLAARVRDQLGKDFETMPGAGAAGGMGFGLAAFLGARLRPGVEIVLDMVGIDGALVGADLVFTAEGRIDFQTAFGKGPAGVGRRAKQQGIPCLALAGGLSGDFTNLHDLGINACFSLCTMPMSLDAAMGNAVRLLTETTGQVLRAFLAGGASGAGAGDDDDHRRRGICHNEDKNEFFR